MKRKVLFAIVFTTLCLLSVSLPATGGTLKEATGISLIGLWQSSVSWGDVDNDGDVDLFLVGLDSGNVRQSILYRNTGSTFLRKQTLTGVIFGSLAWGDYDRDGDLDLALSGQVEAASVRFTKVYANNNGTLTDSGMELLPVWAGSLAWGDYDNDGDLDLALTGWNNTVSPYRHAKIYLNSNGTFVEDTDQELSGVQNSALVWADYDNDGDLDLFLCGLSSDTRISVLYRNDKGKLKDTGITFPGMEYGWAAWADYDNDGDMDLAICGNDGTNNRFLIYENDGGTLDTSDPIQPMGANKGVIYGSLAWGDYDNDGDLDIAICGFDGTYRRLLLYRNDGGGTFTLDQEPMGENEGVEKGSLAWADYDNDTDLDLVVTGLGKSGPVSKIFKNGESKKNKVPSAPTSLTCLYSNGELTLYWTDGDDDSTPTQGLYSHIRVGSEPGLDDLVPARYGSPLLGNFLSKKKEDGKNSLTFKVYAKGYYWSVQTIDTSLGYSWSTESTESGWSEESHYVDETPPPAPETPTDEGKYTYSTTVRFKWTQKAPDPETAIYNYRLQVVSEDGTVFDGNVGDRKSYSVDNCKYYRTYKARVKAQSGGGWGDWSGWSDGIKVVRLLDVANNLIHPHESDRDATIKYFIINSCKVTLKIYNLMGELVKTLVNGENKTEGEYVEVWSGRNDKGAFVASGIYLVHIIAGKNTATEKICVVK